MRLPLLHSILAAVILAFTASHARASFLFTVAQSGSNVVATGTGTLNLTALTLANTSSGPEEIIPTGALLSAGSSSEGQGYVGLSGPASFGTGGPTIGSGTGNQVVIVGANGELFVYSGYVSGSALSDTVSFANTSLSTLGVKPGTYTYSWGSVAAGTADSLIVAVAPEPSTWAMLLGGAGLFGLALLRTRVSQGR